MATKIQCSYGGGSETVLLSLAQNKFFGYEKDADELHARYGGKMYYTSGSGLSGAGFLQPEAGQNDLVEFGWYRTDCRGEQSMMTVGQYSGGYNVKPIFGYAPITSHGGIQTNRPFVLTDGETVAFLTRWDVVDALKDWNKIRVAAIEKPFTVFDPRTAKDHGLILRLYNPNHLTGVNALRFFDLRQWRPSDENPAADLHDPRKVCEVLRLTAVERIFFSGTRQIWLHKNSVGIFDRAFDTDPLTITGEIHDGWMGDGAGLVWRRNDLDVYALLEIPWAKLADIDAKFAFEGDTAWIEFEENIPVVEWFSLNETARRDRLMAGILTKAENTLEAHERELAYAAEMLAMSEALMSLLQANRELVVSLTDSYAAGNCKPGTERFCKLFGITDESVSIGQLLEHRKFSLMLANERFEAVLWHVLKNAGLVDEAETKPRRPVRRPVDDGVFVSE